MITGPIIAEIAALVGDPARATIVATLLDGRPLAASELAVAARITPQTASTHLAKLTEAGLLSVVRHGRHRHFRLASPAVMDMIDGIVAVALAKRPRYRPLSRQARALSAARICYDHLAGRLSVDLTDAFVAREYVVVDDDDAAEITTAGIHFLAEFGIELPAGRSTRRRVCRLCLDWTERRPHHRRCTRSRDHQALLRPRLDGADEGRPRRRRHPGGTAGLPEDVWHRRVRAGRPQEALVAAACPALPVGQSPRSTLRSPSKWVMAALDPFGYTIAAVTTGSMWSGRGA
jgi:DNA-binding transcriptional ArsR family regulator